MAQQRHNKYQLIDLLLASGEYVVALIGAAILALLYVLIEGYARFLGLTLPFHLPLWVVLQLTGFILLIGGLVMLRRNWTKQGIFAICMSQCLWFGGIFLYNPTTPTALWAWLLCALFMVALILRADDRYPLAYRRWRMSQYLLQAQWADKKGNVLGFRRVHRVQRG